MTLRATGLTPDRNKSASDFLRDLKREVVGRRVKIERPVEGSPVILIGVDFKIVVETFWRLADQDRIIATCEDDGHLFGRSESFDAYKVTNEKLFDKELKIVEFNARTGDLRLGFADDLVLEIISTSCGYESWVMWRNDSVFAVGANMGLV